MRNKADDPPAWGLQRRLEFIEWRLYWEGRLNRSDLEERFRISTPQASLDLAKYQSNYPSNIRYDKTLRTYLPINPFRPQYIRPSSDRYLLQLRALDVGAIGVEDTSFGWVPNIEIVRDSTRSIDADKLRTLVQAIRSNSSVDIYYRSLRDPRYRSIAPHALAFDGYRWHARAWCHDSEAFRDFVLARVGSVGSPTRSDVSPDDDVAWQTVMALCITAHPYLDEAQKKTIEMDYGMANGSIEISMNIAMAYYFIRRNYLDLDYAEEDTETLKPERRQIFLKNYHEVMAAYDAAPAESKRRVLARRESGGGNPL